MINVWFATLDAVRRLLRGIEQIHQGRERGQRDIVYGDDRAGKAKRTYDRLDPQRSPHTADPHEFSFQHSTIGHPGHGVHL